MKFGKRLAAALAVPLVAGGLAVAAGTAHAATKTPLPVTFSHDGSTGTAGFDAAGNIALNLGNGTFAEVDVTLSSTVVGHAEPAAPPSFTTDKYNAGSPRWVVELSDGYYLFGFPSQLGAGATDDFTGPQWSVQGPSATACGSSYVTYAKALSCADPAGSGHVTHAFVVEDADQAANTVDTIGDLQYDGLTPVPPAQPIVAVLSHGHVVSISNNRAVLAWQVTPDKVNRFQVTMHVSGPLNNRTGITTIPQASYSGLPAGHSGYITVQALVPNASGQLVPSGNPGTIYFVTPRVTQSSVALAA